MHFIFPLFSLLAAAGGILASPLTANPRPDHSWDECKAGLNGELPYYVPTNFNFSGTVRRYFIAAEIETWDYAPTGLWRGYLHEHTWNTGLVLTVGVKAGTTGLAYLSMNPSEPRRGDTSRLTPASERDMTKRCTGGTQMPRLRRDPSSLNGLGFRGR